MVNKANVSTAKQASKGQITLFYILLAVTVSLLIINVAQARGYFVPGIAEVVVDENTINLNAMTLEEKIAQMVVTHGGTHNMEAWKKLQLGGIHFFAMQTEQLFLDIIGEFQEGMQIPFFVTADLEGCLNLFANFKDFPLTSSITTVEDAFAKGQEEGAYLASLGFNFNFAPVVDLEDTIWLCRSFPGDEQEITQLAQAYIDGLQSEGVLATAKHYPGRTLEVSDPHQNLVSAAVEEEDLYPYDILVEEDAVASVMISHLIVEGAASSQGVPGTVSPELIGSIKDEFSGLIVSDELSMLGLQNFYQGDLDSLYIDVVLAGNDIILNFNEDPNEIYRMITVIAGAVEEGIIDEAQIDASVTKILEAKGLEVVS